MAVYQFPTGKPLEVPAKTLESEFARLRAALAEWHDRKARDARTAEQLEWYRRHDPKNEPPEAA